MIRTIRKALMAAGFTFAAALGGSMLDGTLTATDALVALGMGLVGGAATYQIPNAPAASRRLPQRRL